MNKYFGLACIAIFANSMHSMDESTPPRSDEKNPSLNTQLNKQLEQMRNASQNAELTRMGAELAENKRIIDLLVQQNTLNVRLNAELMQALLNSRSNKGNADDYLIGIMTVLAGRDVWGGAAWSKTTSTAQKLLSQMLETQQKLDPTVKIPTSLPCLTVTTYCP